MLHRSVSAVIWALPFCPSPFLPHISAAFSLVRRAGCTFSARSISLGWLIQFSKNFCEGLLYNPYTYSILKGVFGNHFFKFSQKKFAAGIFKSPRQFFYIMYKCNGCGEAPFWFPLSHIDVILPSQQQFPGASFPQYSGDKSFPTGAFSAVRLPFSKILYSTQNP